MLKSLIDGTIEKAESFERIEIGLITDMPLQPWFEYALKDEWRQRKIELKIRRINWNEQEEVTRLPWNIVWLSREAFFRISKKDSYPGIWIVPDFVNDLMNDFYGYRWRISSEISEIIRSNHCIDLTGILYNLKEKINDDSEKRWGDEYGEIVQRKVAAVCCRHYFSEKEKPIKAIILDCDGVLWPGILSEDGVQNIFFVDEKTKEKYRNFQKWIRRLVENGILVGLCSKNENSEVMLALRDNKDNILSEKYLATSAIDMVPKSEGMKDIMEKLNVLPSEVIFIDDNEWEIEEVKRKYPDIKAIKFDVDTIMPKLYYYLCIDPEQKTNAMTRLHSYQMDHKRIQLMRESKEYDSFLENLQTEIMITPAAMNELDRISELSRRTNQCTNGVRYSIGNLHEIMNDEERKIFSVNISDRYSDLGLAGCFVVNEITSELELFCLSCRVLGRKIEDELLKKISKQNIHIIKWTDTGRNSDFHEKCSQLFVFKKVLQDEK